MVTNKNTKRVILAEYAEYCYCKNTYTNKCDNNRKKRCKAHPIWKQGIGDIGGKKSEN